MSSVVAQESPIWIVKGLSSISPNPAAINQSTQLKITICNLYENESSCTLKASAEGKNASIYPSGEFNVTVLGKGHGGSDYRYSAYANSLSYFQFTLKANHTGSYPVTVELWYGGRQVDFYSETLQVVEGQPIYFPYELRVALVYFVALLIVGVVYIKVFHEEGHLKGENELFFAICAYIFGIVGLVGLTYVVKGFSLVLSQSVGRMELILAFTFIFSFVSLILMKGRLDASLKLANVIIIMVTIPIVLDWFILPSIPSDDTLLGRVVWQLVEIALGIIIGAIVGLMFERRKEN